MNKAKRIEEIKKEIKSIYENYLNEFTTEYKRLKEEVQHYENCMSNCKLKIRELENEIEALEENFPHNCTSKGEKFRCYEFSGKLFLETYPGLSLLVNFCPICGKSI